MISASSITKLLVLNLLLTGCAALNKPASTAQHDLGPLIETPAHDNPNSDKNMTITAPEWLNDTRLRYRQLYKAPTLVKAYSLDRWIAPPERLLTRYFAALPLPAGTRLRMQVIDFEQQFDSADSAKSLFRFRVELFDKDQKTIKTHVFSFTETNETPDAKGAIKSFVALTRQAKIELINWLGTSMN